MYIYHRYLYYEENVQYIYIYIYISAARIAYAPTHETQYILVTRYFMEGKINTEVFFILTHSILVGGKHFACEVLQSTY
jgi:hypothetical protein